ncbi:MAG TPA: discoidin domain-containing protein [Pirellulales bacterium]|nr:discoidin domain-containing protein [Pirellulales bacterium]
MYSAYSAMLHECVLATLFMVACAVEMPAGEGRASASATQDGAAAAAALDGNRFSVDAAHVWKGRDNEQNWWWQCSWEEPKKVGAILQIVGDDPLRLRNAPKKSRWQSSLDGQTWTDLSETAVESECRIARLHRLHVPRQAKHLKLRIDSVHGEFPTLREVEVFADPQAIVDFPEWLVVVSTLDRREWDNRHPAGTEFVALARHCPGWEEVPAQQVWLGSFDEAYVATEPRPLCAFFTGNFSDWCQKDREAWRGTATVLAAGRLPMWASCGGAQGLAILADVGVDGPWDCPHCRDPKHPKVPIYTHLAHRSPGKLACGDYEHCQFERGPHNILQLADDPVFRGLPREFRAMESHCGQIAYAPQGWIQIASKGTGAQTEMQCLRVADRPIYAAQFHIEMPGTPRESRRIVANFLELAKKCGGYQESPRSLALPKRFGTD